MFEDWRGVLVEKFYSKIEPGWNILDIGTGFLSNLEILIDSSIHKATIWTVDKREEPLKRAKKIYNRYYKVGKLKTMKADVENLPFDDDFFDLVVSTLLMHHIKDVNKALTEMIRVLKKGRYLVIVDWDVGGETFVPHSKETLAESKVKVLREIKKFNLENFTYEEYGEWYLVYGKKK